MRILVTIPHFFRKEAVAAYGSESGNVSRRASALLTTLTSLKQTYGHQQAHMNKINTRTNRQFSTNVDIVVCTTGANHILDHIPAHLFAHKPTSCDPRFLGYECHQVLADRLGDYDYYCFMEDDLKLTDPIFFSKLQWFTTSVGTNSVLQPHRFETATAPPPLQALH